MLKKKMKKTNTGNNWACPCHYFPDVHAIQTKKKILYLFLSFYIIKQHVIHSKLSSYH